MERTLSLLKDSEFELEKEKQKQKPSFTFAESFLHECRIIFGIFIKITVMLALQLLPQVIGNMFIGHLRNQDTAMILSAVGLAQNFANITGISGTPIIHIHIYMCIIDIFLKQTTNINTFIS